jgi:DNA-binding transcriptional ArsR family regulator
MRIAAVLERRDRLSPLQRKVLDYLESHGDEVFTYRDVALARATKAKLSAVGFTLWGLEKKGLIEKEKVGRKVYFGSHDAIAELKRRASATPDEDWFEMVNRIREEVFKKHGYIDVLQLLDDVREGR